MSEYISGTKSKFSIKATCFAGIGLINCLKNLHSIGKIYNNLSIDNVVVESVDKAILRVALVNFEHCTDYLKSCGAHIDPGYVK